MRSSSRFFADTDTRLTFVEGDDPAVMHELMAATLETVIGEIRNIQADARKNGFSKRPIWPMIVMRTPKGWTCPKEIDGKREEGYWRSHQVPMSAMRGHPEHVRILETWMKSYRPEELFDENGPAQERTRRACAGGDASDERQSARQRRSALARPEASKLPRLCGRGAVARLGERGSDARSWANSCAT